MLSYLDQNLFPRPSPDFQGALAVTGLCFQISAFCFCPAGSYRDLPGAIGSYRDQNLLFRIPRFTLYAPRSGGPPTSELLQGKFYFQLSVFCFVLHPNFCFQLSVFCFVLPFFFLLSPISYLLAISGRFGEFLAEPCASLLQSKLLQSSFQNLRSAAQSGN
jgi:hypothetical protein